MMPFVSHAPRPYKNSSSSLARIGTDDGGTVSSCVQNLTRPSTAKAKTLKRSAVTCCRSARYPSDARCEERNSPTSPSVPVTEGMLMSFFVSSKEFMRQTSSRLEAAQTSYPELQ